MTQKKSIEFNTFMLVWFVYGVSCLFYYLNPGKFVPDDSLFYQVIAQYIAESGVSTFNGLIDTNGYHPLWMLFNVLAVYFSKLLSIDPLYIVGFMFQVLVGLSIYMLYKIHSVWNSFLVPLSSLIIIIIFLSNGVLQNMESALALFFVLYTLLYYLKHDMHSVKQFISLGILLGLVVLSRLDLIFFGLLFAVSLLWSERETIRQKPKLLLVFIVGGLLIMLPYLLYNYTVFGSIMPISGALKSSYPVITFSWHRLIPYGMAGIFASLLALAILPWIKEKKIRLMLFVLSVSTVFHAFYLAMYQFPMTWYFITGYLLFAIMAGYVIQQISKLMRLGNIFIYSVLGFVAVLAMGISTLRYYTDFNIRNHLLQGAEIHYQPQAQFKKMAEKIAEQLPENATVMTWDLPGVLAYFGKLKVFSADGLISNKTYQEELVTLGAKKVFDQYKIQYIIVPVSSEGTYYNGMALKYGQGGHQYIVSMRSRLKDKDVGEFIFHDSDLVMKTHVLPDVNNSLTLGVFRIQADK